MGRNRPHSLLGLMWSSDQLCEGKGHRVGVRTLAAAARLGDHDSLGS